MLQVVGFIPPSNLADRVISAGCGYKTVVRGKGANQLVQKYFHDAIVNGKVETGLDYLYLA